MCITIYGSGNHTIADRPVAPSVRMEVNCEGQVYLLDQRRRDGFDPVGLRRFVPVVGLRLPHPVAPWAKKMSVDCTSSADAMACSDMAMDFLASVTPLMAHALADVVLWQQQVTEARDA